uniref:Uncharacterized protein n=1 Tax=Oryza barthii TaxID=65489 RepID=A0A0D3HBH3_9ORYZ
MWWRKRMKGRHGGGKGGECGSATGVHESSGSVGRRRCSAVRWWRQWSAVNGQRDLRAAELGWEADGGSGGDSFKSCIGKSSIGKPLGNPAAPSPWIDNGVELLPP